MKKILLIAFMGAFALSINAQVQNYTVGQVVNDFTVVDTDGNSHNLYSYTAAGKHVFLDFFFANCPPCQATSPIWNEFYDKYGCNAGDVICLTVNSGQDNDAQVIAYEQTYGGSFHHSPAVSSDGGSAAVASNFGVGTYPTYCLIGPDNKLKNGDIWVNGTVTIADLENTFPTGFNPSPMPCTVGINEEIKQGSFTIYPNPAHSKDITIMVDNAVNSTVIISDLTGRIVYTSTSSNQKFVQIDKVLNAGTYIVYVETNGRKATQKLVVQ